MKKLIISLIFLLTVISSYSISLQRNTTEIDSLKIQYRNLQFANQAMLDLKGCNREIILLRNRLINTEKVADSYKRKAKEAVKADSTCQQGLNNLTGQVKNLEKQNTNLTLVNKDLTKQADKGRIATLALGISTPILTIAAFIAGIFIAK